MRASKKKIRRLLFFSLSVILGTVAIATAAQAALSEPDQKENLFQIGYLETAVEEDFVPPQGIALGEQVEKTVQVKNTGNVSQFVRVMVLPMITRSKTLTGSEALVLPATIGKELVLENLDTTHWQAGEDGYYYYLAPIAPEEVTPALFTHVTLADALPEEYVGSDLEIQLKVEATGIGTQRKAWWGTDTAPTEPNLAEIDNQLQGN